MTIDLNFLDGKKTYLLGGFAILLALLKIFSDVPEIEGINVLGITDPWTLLTTGWGVIAGRSALTKVGSTGN